MGMGEDKLGPVGSSISGSCCKTRTLACSKMEESARGINAAWHPAEAAGVSRPVAPQPACAVPATEHASLNS